MRNGLSSRRGFACVAWVCAIAWTAGGCTQAPVEPTELQTRSTTLEGNEVCGQDVFQSADEPFIDPCSEFAAPVFQAETFVRGKGTPIALNRSFTVPRNGRVCVKITNGDGTGKGSRIASGSVVIDGHDVVNPDQFDKHFTELKNRQPVAAGVHELDVRLASTPGSVVTVEVLWTPDPQEPSIFVEGDGGLLQVGSLFSNHTVLSPNDDGRDETTTLSVGGLPLEKPGEETGEYQYFLEWEFHILDLATCEVVKTISGTTEINSPTLIHTEWDGTNETGDVVGDGIYGYTSEVTFVRSDGTIFDTATTETRLMLVDSRPVEFDKQFDGTCDLFSDPFFCECPTIGGGGPSGVVDTCDHIGFSALVSPLDPGLDKSFITSSKDSGRWTVVADLRDYNGGGLVPQHSGVWTDAEELDGFIAGLTGVPSSGSENLMDFDFVQIGYSTVVNEDGYAPYSFGHFLLDAISDGNGSIHVGGETIDLRAVIGAQFADDYSGAPAAWTIAGASDANGCNLAGDSDGIITATAKFCAVALAIDLSPTTADDRGFYINHSELFDVRYNDVATDRQVSCPDIPGFQCTWRTWHRNFVGTLGTTSLIDEQQGAPTIEAAVSGIDRISISVPRNLDGEVSNGTCGDATATRDGLTLDVRAADGRVPRACVINYIF